MGLEIAIIRRCNMTDRELDLRFKKAVIDNIALLLQESDVFYSEIEEETTEILDEINLKLKEEK